MKTSKTSALHPKRPAFRLNKILQSCVYLTYGVLFFTGLAWVIGSTKDDSAVSSANDWQPFWLKLHGAAAIPALIIIGILIPLHMQRAWKAKKNRVTGLFMIAINVVLILTAWSLNYGGDEGARGWISKIHIAIGLFFPVALVFHIWIGRKK